jgi:outer membrane protein assembly factor BamB
VIIASLRRFTRLRLVGIVAAALLIGACSSDKPKPAALENFTPSLPAKQAWSTRIDSVKFPLAPVARNGQFAVAGSDGQVAVLRADSGAEVWRASAGDSLSAGVGSDGRFVSVVTTRNEVVTMEAGRTLWRQRVPARVVTAPFVAGERVFVMSVDRVVHAFDALNGRRLWTLQRPGDALTLAQAGVLGSYKNLLIVGQGPRMTAVDPLRGTVQWEVPLATPRGTNEVERLADLIGPAVRVGDRLCARAFQSSAGCLDASRGTLLWSKGSGGAQALAADAERVVGADASDRISAWKAITGDVLWTSEKLLNRGLSGALLASNTVLFGDQEGYVHFLSATTGDTQQRLPTDGSPVVGTPVLLDGTVLVATRNGGLFAFRLN